MIIEICSSIGAVMLYICFIEKRKNIASFFKNLGKSQTPIVTENLSFYEPKKEQDLELPNIGITFEDITLHETEEQHLFRLKTLYPDAWAEYKNHISSRRLDENKDAIVLKYLVDARAGDCTVKVKEHQMVFNNDLTIWISNRWFGFGSVEKCNGIDYYVGDFLKERVSDYTFMTLVDFYYEKTNFNKWKTDNDAYTTAVLDKRSK